LAPFARLTGGEWRVTFESGESQRDLWIWGPGRRSILNRTEGSDASGNPWRALDVYYWHPGREEVRLLGFRQHIATLGRGLAEGRMRFDGERAEAEFELWQPEFVRQPRWMGLRWEFDGPHAYRETLLEGDGLGDVEPLAAWDYERPATGRALPPRATSEAPEPEHPMASFVPLLGRNWLGRDAESADLLLSTVEWIPRVEVVHLRVTSSAWNEPSLHLLEAFVYHHPTADELRCLALTADGSVHEGEVSALAEGDLRLELRSHGSGREVVHDLRLELEESGSLHERAWILEAGERRLLSDRSHRAFEPGAPGP